jgi:hypothetical protein
MLGAYASVAAAPVALFVMAALLAIQAREANWAGVLRRFRMGAWVTSCLLCIAYAGCIMVTTQCEDKLIDAFNQSIAMGEGQYVAKLAGLPWPS